MSLSDLVVGGTESVLHGDAVIRRRFPDVDPRVLEI